MLCARAAWIALRRRGLALGSPPPAFAAMVISFDNLLNILPRFASIAPLNRLTFDHLLCPAIRADYVQLLIETANFRTTARPENGQQEGKLTRIASFAGRVSFVLVAGILAAIATNVSYWNWYGFPSVYTASYMLIQIVGFFLVGVVAALLLPKRAPAA